jgi:phosphate transport system permease protein
MTTAPARIVAKQRPADRVFRGGATFAGSLILVILAAVAIFLIAQSIPAFVVDPSEIKGSPDSFWTYVGPLVFGTVWPPRSPWSSRCRSRSASRSSSPTTPRAVWRRGSATSSTCWPRCRRRLRSLGWRGARAGHPTVYGWLAENASWIPLFAPESAEPGSGISTVSGTGRTILTVGIVLAVMILPIITALCREIFLQTPKLHEEAALALGATRWEMIRTAVLPFGRSGIVSASMLGLGRALGETMAVAMVLSPAAVISFVLTSSQNPSTIASNIALNYPEAHGGGRQRADRDRPDPVRHHLRRERDRPRSRQPPQGLLGSELMTTATRAHRQRAHRGKLPRAPPASCSPRASRSS